MSLPTASSVEECSPSTSHPTTATSSTTAKDYGTNKCLQVLCTRWLLCNAIYFALAYFIQGISDIASGFVNLPLQTILKDRLHLSPSQMGTFFFTCTVTYVFSDILST